VEPAALRWRVVHDAEDFFEHFLSRFDRSPVAGFTANRRRTTSARRAKKVLEYVRRVWRRPVRLQTVNERAEPVELAA